MHGQQQNNDKTKIFSNEWKFLQDLDLDSWSVLHVLTDSPGVTKYSKIREFNTFDAEYMHCTF